MLLQEAFIRWYEDHGRDDLPSIEMAVADASGAADAWEAGARAALLAAAQALRRRAETRQCRDERALEALHCAVVIDRMAQEGDTRP